MPISTVNVLLFNDFELLDAAGPIELLATVPGVDVRTVFLTSEQPAGHDALLVRSHQGIEIAASTPLSRPCDLLLVPGGVGTRRLVNQTEALRDISEAAQRARVVASVCTGSAILAAAGLLEVYAATSNKMALSWVRTHGSNVDWIDSARWVHDRDRWTSSGVSAGMDMTAALLREEFGDHVHDEVMRFTEYVPERDCAHDPFAVPTSAGTGGALS